MRTNSSATIPRVMKRPAALGVIALTLALALAYGIWYSYSVIVVALLAEFGWSRLVLVGRSRCSRWGTCSASSTALTPGACLH